MPIPIQREDDKQMRSWERERCCFCRRQTMFWATDSFGKVTGQSPACCEGCASVFEPHQMPTKAEWVKRERAIDAGNKKTIRTEN